jgi:hypothetical protein
LRRTIITLTLTLTVFSVSFGQNFKKDIKDGLYIWCAGLVIQLDTDTLRTFKTAQSKSHFYKVADITFDSAAKRTMPKEADLIWNEIKPLDRLIEPTKPAYVSETGKSKYSIIYPDKSGFMSVNFIKRQFGYEMHFSKHNVKMKKAIESVKRDTATYFMVFAFTLDDLKNLKMLRDFNDMNPTETEALATVLQECGEKNLKLFEGNKTFGIALDGLDSYGIIEARELIIKSLVELKYCPLIDSNDPDLIFDKLKPFLKRKR